MEEISNEVQGVVYVFAKRGAVYSYGGNYV
jgi:hypothetical protein